MNSANRKNLALMAQSEINPDLFMRRAREARRKAWIEALGILSFVVLVSAFAFVWLAYEGWITPAAFN